MSVHQLSDRASLVLPRIEAVDHLDAEALVDALTRLGALVERARARLHLAAANALEPAPGEEYLSAEGVAALLHADQAWVYRHARQLGGVKLDGLLRFSRRRLDAYLARQARLGA